MHEKVKSDFYFYFMKLFGGTYALRSVGTHLVQISGVPRDDRVTLGGKTLQPSFAKQHPGGTLSRWHTAPAKANSYRGSGAGEWDGNPGSHPGLYGSLACAIGWGAISRTGREQMLPM